VKKIKYLQILFNEEITSEELPKFRGAVIDAASQEHILFHNHQDENYRYAYPLIQYKRLGKRAAIVCLEQGTEEIHAFFSRPNPTLRIGNREIHCKIDRLYLNEFTLQTWDRTFSYKIEKWLAVKDDNFHAYTALESEAERQSFLARMLTGNILSMAKGLSWTVEQPIEIEIKHIMRQRKVIYKDTLLSAFDVAFTSNVYLPDYIGLGKSSAMGFGIVRKNENPVVNSGGSVEVRKRRRMVSGGGE
jgi:hypothetical protein